MADPQHFNAAALHPCKACRGKRGITYFSWRDPDHAYQAYCHRCGNAETGKSVAAVTQAWNTNNPDREVDPTSADPVPGTTEAYDLLREIRARAVTDDEVTHVLQMLDCAWRLRETDNAQHDLAEMVIEYFIGITTKVE